MPNLVLLDAATTTGYGPTLDLVGLAEGITVITSGPGTVTIEGSPDGTTWMRPSVTGYSASFAPVRYLRANLTATGGGSTTVRVAMNEVSRKIPPGRVGTETLVSSGNSGTTYDLRGVASQFALFVSGDTSSGAVGLEGSLDGTLWYSVVPSTLQVGQTIGSGAGTHARYLRFYRNSSSGTINAAFVAIDDVG